MDVQPNPDETDRFWADLPEKRAAHVAVYGQAELADAVRLFLRQTQ
jgi:hypothetical protein